MSDARQKRIQEMQNAAWQRGDASGWFEELYAAAGGDKAQIPWSERGVNEHIVPGVPADGAGRTAVVIGCGLGDNAEFLAGRGFAVTAFDISPTAVDWCRKRFPESKVRYVVGDLFTAARDLGQFDFVLEVHTLQALPRSLRAQAVAAVAALVRDRLLVVCRGCREPQPDETIPWPLTREELAGFGAAGLTEVSFDDFWDYKEPPCRRFRVTYQRAYTK